MAHVGTAPLDPNTDVGALRTLVGDTTYKALSPTQEGKGDYAVFSDTDLQAALYVAEGNIYRAAGDLYSQIAARYAQQGKVVKTNDLSLTTTGRAGDLAEIAQGFYEQARLLDESRAGKLFTIVGFAGRPDGGTIRPEATPYPTL